MVSQDDRDVRHRRTGCSWVLSGPLVKDVSWPVQAEVQAGSVGVLMMLYTCGFCLSFQTVLWYKVLNELLFSIHLQKMQNHKSLLHWWCSLSVAKPLILLTSHQRPQTSAARTWFWQTRYNSRCQIIQKPSEHLEFARWRVNEQGFWGSAKCFIMPRRGKARTMIWVRMCLCLLCSFPSWEMWGYIEGCHQL